MRVITFVLGLTLATSTLVGASTASRADEVTPATESVSYKDWGRARAPDQVLRKGCNLYRFRYRVRPPAGEFWTAEIFLKRPDGVTLGHRFYNNDKPDPDPKRATRRIEVCKSSTWFGRHKLSMRVTWFDEDDDPHSGWVKPSYFRMMRP
ncbi:hypothetical protein HNR19_001661 [Nocardioides thalensis]|uniref:Secreted protein n=1 Tax=Nocardioides thalensis TaxID=1914755 RepID=A0A853C3T0_9ACTN|nr:hypothetical protein [Nocardioides thalensis]NYJ00963.1 hypothetical protein [Nocardioides thalensis]